jgi:hypothetical protein
MKKMRDEWEDKQGIFFKHDVKDVNRDFLTPMEYHIKNCQRARRANVIEILEKYNALLKEEYQDSDLWDIISHTTDKFLLKYYPKID